MFLSKQLIRGVICGAKNGLPRATTQSRCMCAAPASYISVKTDDKTGIATVTMNRKPVNSLNLEMLTDLHIALEKLENNCSGIILTSSLATVFSAGIDIGEELYQPKKERLTAFWHNFQEVYLKLYGSSRPVIAAINGHAPAGGCLLASASDYRIMAQGNYNIGLNETLLGIVAPFWFRDLMVSIVGQREASRGIQLGHMYSTDEALKVGLVDLLVPQDQVLSTAEEHLKKWIAIPDHARQLSKMAMNKENINRLLSRRVEDITNFVTYISKDSIQKNIGVYLDSLKQRAKKK